MTRRIRKIKLAGAAAMVVAISQAGLAQSAAPPTAAAAKPGTFLALSDIHLAKSAGIICGESTNEETSPALWVSAQKKAKALIQTAKPAFAIYIGDLPTHCRAAGNEFQGALDGLADIVGTGTKLIYLPGNNDSLGGDYQAFTFNGKTPLDRSAPWSGAPVLNAASSDLIDTANLPKGYYSVYAVQATAGAPALRVIALNTNIFTATYTYNNGGTYQADTNAQLEWLNAQLLDVQSKGEKVVIAMHVPPGIDGHDGSNGTGIKTMWRRDLNYTGTDPALVQGWVQQTFLTIVAGYGPEIVGLLSSHTHANEIRRLRDCSQKLPKLGTFTELDLAIPSITTDHGNNPSLKVVSYDSSFEWTDNTTWYASDNSGTGWNTNKALSFDLTNYPCKGCAPGDTLKARIAALDNATVIGTSKSLTSLMLTWLAMKGRAPTNQRNYAMSLDATCEAP